MNEMVVSYQPNGGQAPARAAEAPPPPAFSFDQMVTMAEFVSRSGFCPGVKTPAEAMSLMLVCQAQNRHIGEAITRFHVIKGVPSVKAEVMLADFQARGGRVKWVVTNKEVCRAEWSHPALHPDPLVIEVSLKEMIDSGEAMSWDDRKKAMVVKDRYVKSPAQMLRARNVSQGVRAIDPGAIHGFYTPEEVRDFTDDPPSRSIESKVAKAEAAIADSRPATSVPDVAVIGDPDSGADVRPYVRVAEEAVAAHNARVAEAWQGLPEVSPPAVNVRDLHRHVLFTAINLGHAEGPPPNGLTRAIAEISGVYKAHRAWVRGEINAYLAKEAESANAALGDAIEQANAEVVDPADYGGEVPAEVA